MPETKKGGHLSRPPGPPTHGRAQGDQRIPWPAGIVNEPDNCCVALRVRIATTRPEGSLTVALSRPRVARGPALTTLLELIGEHSCFGDNAREILRFEVEQIGWIDPGCPLRLERVTDLGEQKVFIEALVLPFGEQEAAELGQLLRATRDAADRQEAGWQYAQKLERRWEQRAPGGRVPCRYLDVDFPEPREKDASGDAGADEALPARRQPLPANL
jgi:hypothetical protein